MHAGCDLLDFSILYDAARGFLGLRTREERLRYALLSLVGASGAAFALHLERAGGRLAIRGARGIGKPDDSIPLGRKLAAALSVPEPVRRDRLGALGAPLARLVTRHRIEILVGLRGGEQVDGAFALGPKLFGEDYEEREISLVAEIAKLASLSLGPAQLAARPGGAARESRRIEALRRRFPFLREFHGEGRPTAALFEELVALADFDLPVLVLGETGTGKELVARFIHELSRREGSFEAINCAAIPSELMASALFGHEQGAFTGAVSRVRGAFERAGSGTIFLDEIGDMPPDTQASLLRVLQERSFHRVGGEAAIAAQARVISATNRNLLREVEKGSFRADLFYRLQMYSVRIPPLRERREEIPTLAAHILEQHRQAKSPLPDLSPEFLRAVSERPLPGNMRELESLIVGAIVRAGGAAELLPEHLPPEGGFDPGASDGARGTVLPALPGIPATPGVPVASTGVAAPGVHAASSDVAAPAAPSASAPGFVPEAGVPAARGGVLGQSAPPVLEPEVPSYETMERQYILSVLQLTEGNKKEAAELMGIPRTTLNARIRKLGLSTPGVHVGRARGSGDRPSRQSAHGGSR
jgi:DNA-binding NtrC family response regulator